MRGESQSKNISSIHEEPVELLEHIFYYSRTNAQIVDRNRRATIHRSHLSLVPLEKLFPGRTDMLVYKHPTTEPPYEQRRPGPDDPHWKIPASEWQSVLERIDQGEPLRKVAGDYGVSYEAVRRVIHTIQKKTG